MENNLLLKYQYLSKGSLVAIAFFDGTIIKGLYKALDENIITIYNAFFSFPRNRTLKARQIKIHLNAVDNLIYSVTDVNLT